MWDEFVTQICLLQVLSHAAICDPRPHREREVTSEQSLLSLVITEDLAHTSVDTKCFSEETGKDLPQLLVFRHED